MYSDILQLCCTFVLTAYMCAGFTLHTLEYINSLNRQNCTYILKSYICVAHIFCRPIFHPIFLRCTYMRTSYTCVVHRYTLTAYICASLTFHILASHICVAHIFWQPIFALISHSIFWHPTNTASTDAQPVGRAGGKKGPREEFVRCCALLSQGMY